MFRKTLNLLQARFKAPMQSGQLLLWSMRLCYGVIMIGLAMAAFSNFFRANPGDYFQAWALFLGVLGGGILIVVTDVWFRNKQITTLSALYFGLLLGLLLGYLLSTALEPFLFTFDMPQQSPAEFTLKLVVRMVITTVCCYICISTLLQTKDEFRFIIPYVEFSKQIKGRGRWSWTPV